MTSSIDFNPFEIQILTTETVPLTVEWADLVGKGNNINTPFGVLYDNANGILIPNGFLNDFGANGTQAQYILLGANLQAGHEYSAILSCISLGQTFKGRMKVEVPQ